ncbi:MAG TPA: serine hydrolase [bacterium]|nr:serine hydrolase [bacterium]HPL95625.1 serine hydrolase [bacterium]
MIFTLILSLIFNLSFLPPANNFSGGQILGQSDFQKNGNLQTAGDSVDPFPARINLENLGVKVSATNALALDVETNFKLWEKKSDEKRPIASITKLATTLVLMDQIKNWQEKFTILPEDTTAGSKLIVLPGETITLDNALRLSLIASDNSATTALVRTSSQKNEQFVNQMNAKMKNLGLIHTNFVDPVGLSDKNISTAQEVALLFKKVIAEEKIKDILSLTRYSFESDNGTIHHITNTNKLLTSYLAVLAGKTGSTPEAGDCFVSLIELPNKKQIIVVVLNSSSSLNRFQDTKAIVDWVANNYYWPE